MTGEISDEAVRLTRLIDQNTRHLSLQSLGGRMPFHSPATQHTFPILHPSPLSVDSHYFSPAPQFPTLNNLSNIPYFIKPLPPRVGPDEAAYLEKKGALTVPSNTLRNELLRAYIEFVHPYMPLIDLYDFLLIIETGNGSAGRISLILYHAVMFAGSAFVDMHHLYNAGYHSRKQARKDFFNKTRLLYDFDYESDRVSLVQALLLLTYYYETPDDQKDTWHWMGVATSVAHTIGLHRNPERSNMDSKRTKLWKRIWWSTYMRDRLIALGMRRPTRIKTEDYDVPMITLEDFELVVIPESWSCVPAECTLARDMDKQRELAIMCIEKAKLCLCISHVLSRQYCVLNNNQGMVNDRTTMMLLPKKLDPETSEVKICDDELQHWLDNLPPEAQHRDTFTGDAAVDLSRALLHLVFFTTLSALHRPQVLPATPTAAVSSPAAVDLLDCSRANVRRAATAITQLAQALESAGLVKFLPTTGVTVLLPAIIIHLLDIKSPDQETRRNSLRGFCQCMAVMGKLRDMYTAADYSTAFLEAAIRKAGIHVSTFAPPGATSPDQEAAAQSMHPVTTVEDLVDAGRRLDMVSMPPPAANTLTPPPDGSHALFVADMKSDAGSPSEQPKNNGTIIIGARGLGIASTKKTSDEEVATQLKSFLASTPPDSDHASEAHDGLDAASLAATTGHTALFADDDHHDDHGLTVLNSNNFKSYSLAVIPEFEQDDFDTLLNLDAMAENGAWSFDDGGIHGFTVDMDWLGASTGHGTGADHKSTAEAF
jgi:hypothetical protein